MEFKTIANLARFKDIMMTLVKYGFDDLAQRLEVSDLGPFKKVEGSSGKTASGTYERIRLVLEELGPTFVKFGQIMSIRPDLLPPILIRELGKLQDNVASVEYEQIQTVIENNFDLPLKKVFRVFDREPVAAASLSQVHRAVLAETGKIVSVKVQRPDIQKKIETDLDILEAISNRLHDHNQELKIYDLPNLVRIIRKTLLQEIDFRREARHMLIARANQEGNTELYIPEVYHRFCTREILVTEFIHGKRLKDFEHKTSDHSEALAKIGLRACITQILQDGFFHADPHPGNILFTGDMQLCLLDWGMVGRLTEQDRHELVDLLKAVIDRDSKSLLEILLLTTDAKGDVDRRSLERDLLDILDAYRAFPIKDWDVGQMLLDIIVLLRNYRLQLPPDMVIMVKALVTAEGTARRIYPDLNVVLESEAYVKGLALRRYRPDAMWRHLRFSAWHFLALQRRIPRRFVQIVEKIEQGKLSIRSEHHNLGGLLNTLENTFNRLTLGIITASVIIGSSMIITTGIGPLWFGFPALGILGYSASALFGIWIIINIFRSKKY